MVNVKSDIVTIFGASGFVGRAVVEELARAGYRIRAGERHPNSALFLQPLGGVGQIDITYTDVTRPETVKKAVRGANTVINCVGILYEGAGSRKFKKIQAEAPGEIGQICKKEGVKTLIHISAIGADEKSPAKYARSKAQGEKALLKAFKEAIVLRPSIIFGPDDNFFNAFARMAKSPFQPLAIVSPKTKFQPVFVDDVAAAVGKAVANPDPYRGKIFELGGPKTYTFRELMEYLQKIIEDEAALFTLPVPLAALAGAFFQIAAKILPFPPPITLDQVKLLKRDNVVSGKFPGFEAFEITPRPLEAVVPKYLRYMRAKGQFE